MSSKNINCNTILNAKNSVVLQSFKKYETICNSSCLLRKIYWKLFQEASLEEKSAHQRPVFEWLAKLFQSLACHSKIVPQWAVRVLNCLPKSRFSFINIFFKMKKFKIIIIILLVNFGSYATVTAGSVGLK